ncbi:BamA/TamA family outer membrane protein [Carboxylicivirga sp. A043]|uniref:BamA/TamA family outer membrane protein n=1 Tax=Carboxylicivirga litoralis TaxID=2816963 RepID=UPI0021CB53D6|nr:BamA/TamA family outer membrane protein [Carboxylicivirga sp. A043]MCU4154902.1 BamA/TamA family outer membrane protein [Carboxylicivirga sp. A043]
MGKVYYNALKIIVVVAAILCCDCIAYASNEESPKQTTSDYVVVQQIIISGNKITKPRVILNELIFKKGDKLLTNRLGQIAKRSRHNLLNTSLFNFVSIRYTLQSDNTIIFHLNVDERWYWWVFPIFEVADRNLSSFFNNGDWSRVNYGVYLKRDNFRGRNEKIIARLRLGYATQILLGYMSPEYNKRGGWGASFSFQMYDQLPYTTENNQQIFMGLETELAQVTYRGLLYYSLRTNLYQRHRVQIAYNNFNVSDSIIDLNPGYLTQGDKHLQYLELSYEYDFDKRDSKIYPLKGTRLRLTATQTGFGLWQDDLKNFKLGGSLDKHIELNDRWHWASNVYGEYNTSNSLPYVLNAGSGYKSFLNGYELYVIDGTRQASMKNQMVFTLLHPRVKNIGFMPLTQFAKINYAFYLKAFYDFGYVWQENPPITNTFVNDWQYGYGAGLDFVTFYDMVWSFNYSVNRFKERGFFVHFNLAI